MVDIAVAGGRWNRTLVGREVGGRQAKDRGGQLSQSVGHGLRVLRIRNFLMSDSGVGAVKARYRSSLNVANHLNVFEAGLVQERLPGWDSPLVQEVSCGGEGKIEGERRQWYSEASSIRCCPKGDGATRMNSATVRQIVFCDITEASFHVLVDHFPSTLMNVEVLWITARFAVPKYCPVYSTEDGGGVEEEHGVTSDGRERDSMTLTLHESVREGSDFHEGEYSGTGNNGARRAEEEANTVKPETILGKMEGDVLLQHDGDEHLFVEDVRRMECVLQWVKYSRRI
ncbi:hypothetical protein C8J57DRAFT_1259887 [Mycena rebaudengoi]|nr:hypothetical protein C8J57DRAFT_1259887 [Mycena rebaudengoi]